MTLTVTLLGRGTTGTNSVTTPSATSTNGATFAAFVSYDATAGAITTAGDNKGNTYTAIGTAQADPQGALGRWYVCENGVGGASHTFTFATANNHFGVAHFFEITGSTGVPRKDINAQGQDTSASPWDSVATGTLGYADEAILAGCLANSGLGGNYATSNMTLASSENDVAQFWTSAVGSLIQASTSSFSPSFNRVGDTAGAGIAIVTFREEAGGASTITAAAGVATTSALTGSSTASSTITAAACVASASTLVGSDGSASPGDIVLRDNGGAVGDISLDDSGSASAIVAASGSAVAGTLTGSSTASATITAAAPAAAASTLAGRRTNVSTITAAAAAATASTLNSVAGSSTITPAACAATTSTLTGSSVAVANFGAIPVLGVHTLEGQEETNGTDPVVTQPITTQASGSSLIAFVAGHSSNTGGPADTYSNTWTSAGQEFYTPYGTTYDVRGYYVEQASGGASHTVTFQKDVITDGEATVVFVEAKNAGKLIDWERNYPAAGTTLTSGTVTTTGPAVLIALWWGDSSGLTHSATPSAGWTTIEAFGDLPPNSAVQCFVAAREVSAAGDYSVTWTESPDQGSPLWIFAFQNLSGATAAAATAATLTGTAIKSATITAAAGVATTSTRTGSALASAAMTAATPAATTSTLTGSATAVASLTAAAAAASAGTLTGSGGNASAITPAAAVATTSTLTGSSTAAGTPSAAAGAATAGTLNGASVASATAASASCAATAGDLAGSSTAVASITPAAGAATAGTLVGDGIVSGQGAIQPATPAATAGTLAGSSTAVASIVPADAAATGATILQFRPADERTGGGSTKRRTWLHAEAEARAEAAAAIAAEDEALTCALAGMIAAGAFNHLWRAA